MKLPVAVTLLGAVLLAPLVARADEPPISLSVKDVNLGDAAGALGKALGRPLVMPADLTPSSRRYSLDAKDKPFWEVFKALCGQHALRFAETPLAGMVLSDDDAGWTDCTVFGDMAVVVGEIRYMETVNLQPQPAPAAARRGRGGPDAAPGRLTVQITAALDPRVRIAHIGTPNVLRAADDAGNVLIQHGPWPAIVGLQGSPNHVQTATVELPIPQQPGTKIATLEGELPCDIVTDGKSFDVADLSTMAGKEYEGPGSLVRVDSVDVQDRLIRVTGNVQGGGLMLISDSQGRVLNVTVNLNPGRPFTNIAPLSFGKPPYHATIVAGVPHRQSLPFHFTDLPLPLPRQ